MAGGKCVTADGTLAGSDLDMMSAVRNAAYMLEIDLARAVRMASIVPARFTGIDNKVGEICAGRQADFVVVSPGLEVVETWIAGTSSRG